MEENNEKHYGLSTAVTMIVGIVIGSGIFFKADNILSFTGGNVLEGVLVLCIGALSIIFGSISLTELSVRTTKNGGLVGYFEDFISPEIASAFGWFQTFLYYPTINVVVSWAAGIYTCILFGIDNTLENQILIGSIYLLLIFSMNIFSLKLAGKFQNLTTFIKLVPLLGVAIIGLFWTKAVPQIPADAVKVPLSNVGAGWLAALAPVAFSYDGWPIATSITNEIEKPKKNMPIALIVGPLIVLGVYLAYFVGMTKILGSEYILATGDESVYLIGKWLFGPNGGSIILLFVIISVLGVTNGVTLGNLRMPQALASKNMIPNSKAIQKIDLKKHLSVASYKICLISSFFWMLVHYLTQKTGILTGGDISEIAIVFSYICYILLYVKIIRMRLNGEIKSFFKGVIAPILGICGSIIIVVGGIVSNPRYVLLFIFICSLVCLAGFLYYINSQKSSREG